MRRALVLYPLNRTAILWQTASVRLLDTEHGGLKGEHAQALLSMPSRKNRFAEDGTAYVVSSNNGKEGVLL